MTIDPSVTFHPTSIVDKGATIGAGSRVWQWVHISTGAVIGERCSFGQNVFVGNRVRIGDNVTLEDYVFCVPSMVFTNVYNPRSAVSRKDEYRYTVVEQGATLGANCTVVCGTRIGHHAFVGAWAVLKRDVKPFALMVGVPAKHIGWMSTYGERVDLPLEGSGSWTCPYTGDIYQLFDHHLTHMSA